MEFDIPEAMDSLEKFINQLIGLIPALLRLGAK
ncbi:Protein of unknown function [Bacillus cytotoxicus]|uniref:Uncharacterized protein n=1 Tax=Bacillus cytotoxicus TaxID=580165 RepID=A0AAX2CPH7_9BACI|nr:Protein of unknown function [Bacillus cytotoxicus]